MWSDHINSCHTSKNRPAQPPFTRKSARLLNTTFLSDTAQTSLEGDAVTPSVRGELRVHPMQPPEGPAPSFSSATQKQGVRMAQFPDCRCLTRKGSVLSPSQSPTPFASTSPPDTKADGAWMVLSCPTINLHTSDSLADPESMTEGLDLGQR